MTLTGVIGFFHTFKEVRSCRMGGYREENSSLVQLRQASALNQKDQPKQGLKYDPLLLPLLLQ
jgi:hypothetical protein